MYPLDNLVVNSNNPKDVLLRYLPDKTVSKIHNKLYYDPDAVDLFLNQKVWCVDKYTGKISYNGKIFRINNNWISLQCSNKNIYIEKWLDGWWKDGLKGNEKKRREKRGEEGEGKREKGKGKRDEKKIKDELKEKKNDDFLKGIFGKK